MTRSIQFKLKSGKIVTIRSVQRSDVDAIIKFVDKFTHDPGAMWTGQYLGQTQNKEWALTFYDNPNNFSLTVWDKNTIVGLASVSKKLVNHPYYKGVTAGVGMFLLQKYTHNGLGTKMFQIMEKWARQHGVKTLTGEIRHLNIPSIANCIKAGFLITGIHHNAAKINGKVMHEYIVEKQLAE